MSGGELKGLCRFTGHLLCFFAQSIQAICRFKRSGLNMTTSFGKRGALRCAYKQADTHPLL